MKPQSANIFALAVLEELVANGDNRERSLYAWYNNEKLVIQEAIERLQYDIRGEIELNTAVATRTSERDVAGNDVAELLKPLRTIYDALTTAEDWGELGTILDGSTVDEVKKLLKEKEPRYRGYAYLNRARKGKK